MNKKFKMTDFVAMFLALSAIKHSYVDDETKTLVFMAKLPLNYDLVVDSLLIEEKKKQVSNDIIKTITTTSFRNAYYDNHIFVFDRDYFNDEMQAYAKDNQTAFIYNFEHQEIRLFIDIVKIMKTIHDYNNATLEYMYEFYKNFEYLAPRIRREMEIARTKSHDEEVSKVLLDLEHDQVLPHNGQVKKLVKEKRANKISTN